MSKGNLNLRKNVAEEGNRTEELEEGKVEEDAKVKVEEEKGKGGTKEKGKERMGNRKKEKRTGKVIKEIQRRVKKIQNPMTTFHPSSQHATTA